MSSFTTYIIGAGASAEISIGKDRFFPVGDVLKHQIANAYALKQDGMAANLAHPFFQSALVQVSSKNGQLNSNEMREFVHASQIIRNSMPLAPSIDHFVYAHNQNSKVAFCAKVAILKLILEAEQNSILNMKPDNDQSFYSKFQRLENTWYSKFFKSLIENCTLEELGQKLSHIKFIVFNYDRCVEHFLFQSIKTYFDISDKDTIEILKNLEIIHVYGKLGDLEWQNNDKFLPFGERHNALNFIELTSNIRTFSERTREYANELERLQDIVRASKKYLFLGFSYSDLNMELLAGSKPSPSKDSGKYCFGTAYNFSQADIGLIRMEKISERFGMIPEQIFVDSMTCSQLLSHYSFQLNQ